MPRSSIFNHFTKRSRNIISFSIILSSTLFNFYGFISPALADIAANSSNRQTFSVKKYSTIGKFKANHTLVNPEVAASVELELDTYPVLKILTTTNGKLSSLLQDQNNPEYLSAWMRLNHKDTLDEVAWDELPDYMKLMLLKHISSGRKNLFFSDRKIHNMKVRDHIDLTLNQGVKFNGVKLQTGINKDVDISQILAKNAVEYRGPEDVENASGVELHFREKQPAGKVHEDAWTLLDGLQIARDHQHIHIVAPLPYEQFKIHQYRQALMMADFFKRANLISEMLNVLLGYPITNNVVDDKVNHVLILYFGSMTDEMLEGVTDYFLSVSKLAQTDDQRYIPRIGDRYKIAWVGFRGKDKYDGDLDLWGIEYRDITAMKHTTTSKNILNALQWAMNKNEYGLSPELMEKWDRYTHNGYNLQKKMAATWYNQNINNLLSSAPHHVLAALPKGMNWIERGIITKIAEKNQEIKMLLFNWDNDPLFFQDQKIKNEIKKAQSIALTNIMKRPAIQDFVKNVEKGTIKMDETTLNNLMGSIYINPIIKDFIIDSDILFEVTKSLGLKLQPKLHVIIRTLKNRGYDAFGIAEFLSRIGMNINAVGSKSNTLLSLAIGENEEDLAINLIKAGANKNVTYTDHYGYKISIKEEAERKGMSRVVDALNQLKVDSITSILTVTNAVNFAASSTIAPGITNGVASGVTGVIKTAITGDTSTFTTGTAVNSSTSTSSAH